MKNKVLLILVDGMRPDSIPLCGDPAFEEFFKSGTYCMEAKTVWPSVTLPCHVSLFHSVDPQRHGTTTNIYAPQVRPVNGLVEVLAAAKKKSALLYTWEQLRDVCRPGKLEYGVYIHQHTKDIKTHEKEITRAAIKLIRDKAPDFVFLYLGGTDSLGHDKGWMGPGYLDMVHHAWTQMQEVLKDLPPEYTVMVTADHGGHERTHGENIPEDMLIPVTIHGPAFPKGKQLDSFSILDFAPTIATLLGVEPDEEWEGTSLI
ncbi:MAG: alkaline phosphatase family protein [Clostridia bacterium]|nr:alkaline phosphatase family protein [Clostridia bacterium]